MNDLEKCRQIIDEEDEIIRNAFIKRMRAVEGVIAYKKANSLPILDAKREEEIINRLVNTLTDPKLKKHYEALIRSLMEISKAYQKELLDE